MQNPDSPFKEFPELRKLAAHLMLNHRLPLVVSKTLLAGYGDGSVCCLCDQPITRTDIEYELADAAFTRYGIRLHLWCHNAWQMELAAMMDNLPDNPPEDNFTGMGRALEH